MAKNETKMDEKDNKKPFTITVEEHQQFNPICESKYVTSSDLCKALNALFHSVFSDYEGSTFEMINNRPTIALFFNQREEKKDGLFAATTRTVPTSNTGIDTVDRLRQMDNKQRYGDRYYLTEEGKDGLAKFVSTMFINGRTGSVDWKRIVTQVSSNPGQNFYYGAMATQYTKVSGLDVDRLVSEIYGVVGEDGVRWAYTTGVKTSLAMVSGNMMGAGNVPNVYMLEIKKISEEELQKLCNALGIAGAAGGLDMIR